MFYSEIAGKDVSVKKGGLIMGSVDMKINTLTDEQRNQIKPTIKKWIDIGLSCEKCNRDLAEKLVDRVYSAAEIEPPKNKIWLSSPLSGVVGAALLENTNRILTDIRSRDQVWDQVEDQVWDQVVGQVWDQVEDQVRDQVRSQVWDQVRDQVRSQVVDQVRSQVWDQVYKCCYGIHDSGWLSFYDFFNNCFNLDCIKKIKPLIDFSKEVGWWWPFEGAVIMTERPVFICLDDDGRLHHENRMALEYADGTGVYAWHGIRVPEWIILEPDKITPELVLTEDNQEIRRVMLERYGWDLLLENVGVKELHSDGTGLLVCTDRLSEYLDGEDDEARFVLVKDPSTERRYALRVPPDIDSARAGVAWTFEQEEGDYSPEQES